MASANTHLVTATYGGANTGVWDSHSGGEKTHDNQRHRRGGLGRQKVYSSPAEYGDLTIARDADEDPGLTTRMLNDKVAQQMTVTVTTLGEDGRPDPRHAPRVYVGRFAGITLPESDSDSSDVSMVEVSVTVEEVK